MAEKPMPRIDAINRPFWEACNAERVVIQRCAASACGSYVYYPRVCCPNCRNANLEWVEVSGTGEVVTHTTIHRPHHEAFYSEAPYVFAAIRLSEGPIVYGIVEGAPTDGRSLVGRSVAAAFRTHSPAQKLLAFRLSGTP